MDDEAPETDVTEDDLACFLAARRCACCGQPLRSSATSGYCRRAVCRRHAYEHDPAFREARLRTNSAWHAKKCAADPEWAARRRKASSARRSARRKEAKGG